jgi:nicotinamidase-related amidase
MFFRHPLTLLTEAVPPLEITPHSTRLLLQDVHAPFADAGMGWLAQRADAKVLRREFDEYYDALDLATGAMVRALHGCRARAIPVCYTALGYFPPDAPSVFQRATGWAWALDGPDGRFPAALAPAGGEALYAKAGWGAFSSPAFVAMLQDEGVRTVILCGAMLEYGIRQTSLELADSGIDVLILSDAIVPLTQAGRAAIQGGLSQGIVKTRSVGELLGLFAENAPNTTVLV